MNSDLDIISPTLFQIDSLHNLRDARFTLFDILPLFSDKREHAHLVAMVASEWGSTPSRMPEAITIQRNRNNAAFGVQSYSLTHTQVLRLLSRVTGVLGVAVRDKIERYVDALEVRVLEQQAELVNMRKVVALLRERHADSPATNAFLLGVTSELANWHVTKATLVSVTQDSTGYAYERGKEFATTYGHRILPDESPAEFYVRVQTDLDLEFVGAKPVPTRDTL